MAEKKENPESTELVTVGNETLPDLSRLKPVHFEALEGVLTRFYHYQYRHVQEVGWLKLALWAATSLFVKAMDYAYVDSRATSEVLKGTFATAFVAAFAVGGLCIFSRCFTRLFQFKINALRVSQFIVCITLTDYLSPRFLYLTNYWARFEQVLFVSWYLLLLTLLYWVFDSLIVSRWLRVVRLVCAIAGPLLIAAVLCFPKSRHFMLRDNEVVIYQDFGIRAAEPLDSIDGLIDKVVKDIE